MNYGIRLLICGAASALALLLTLLLLPHLPHTTLGLFYVAVAASGAIAGLGGVTLATVLSLVLAELFVFDPRGGIAAAEGQYARGVLFVLISAGVGALTYRLRRARLRAERQQAEAERLAAELAERSRELELQVGESASMAHELEHANRQLRQQSDSAHRAAVRAERLQRFTAHILSRVGASAVARGIVDEGRLVLDAAAAAVAVMHDDGSVELMAAHGYPERLLRPESDVHRIRSPLSELLRGGDAIFIEDRAEFERLYPDVVPYIEPQHCAWAALPLDANDRRAGVLALSFSSPVSFRADDRSFMLLMAQQCAQALERARLHGLELRARVRAEFAERRLAFLADAGSRLAVSLDYHATLADLARAAVPEIADWCLIHLVDDDGVPRLHAVVHEDDAKVQLRRSLEQRYPAARRATVGYGHVLRTGEPYLVGVVTDEQLRAAAQDEEHLEALRSLGLRSQLTVPIRIEEGVCGTITLANAESGRIFGESDLRLALELGLRAGQAVQNARLYEAAHYASEAKSDFLAVMSHELRTPLNAIIGYADLLLLGVPEGVPDRAHRQVERIRFASTSLLHLVEEVLSFSRVEAGKEDIRISPLDLTAAARDCVSMIEPLAAEKQLPIRIDAPEQPVKVVSDERKVRQILTNLLSNAVKFTETGGITVRTIRHAEEVRIEIGDTGIGISEEHLERIFEPFWQVEQSATRRFGGTGLGLGVARKLARLLEGRLEVHSTLGVGSVFTLILPLRTPGTSRP
jgi:signal transduction histidine kinase